MTPFRLLITVCQLPYFNTDCQMFYFNDACQMYCKQFIFARITNKNGENLCVCV